MSLASRIVQDAQPFTVVVAALELFRARQIVPPGKVWRIDRVAVEVRTDECDLITVFVLSGNVRIFIEQWVAPANPFVYVDKTPFWMGPGQQLGFEAAVTGVGDVLILHYHGFAYDDDLPPGRP